jgi:hypothetical protein
MKDKEFHYKTYWLKNETYNMSVIPSNKPSFLVEDAEQYLALVENEIGEVIHEQRIHKKNIFDARWALEAIMKEYIGDRPYMRKRGDTNLYEIWIREHWVTPTPVSFEKGIIILEALS